MAHSEKIAGCVTDRCAGAVFVARECEIYRMRHTWAETLSDSDLVSKCSLPPVSLVTPPAAFFITIRQLLHPHLTLL